MLRCTILVAVGANLRGPGGRTPLGSCLWAVARLAALPGLRFVAQSRWYETVPVPASEQPNYVNGAVRLQGDAAPDMLLDRLHGIEADGGRVRGAPNSARTLDLDLLAVDDLVVDTPALVLPHPRLQDRAFVLAPLADVAAEWTHPVLHRTVSDLLSRSDRTGLTVLSPQPG